MSNKFNRYYQAVSFLESIVNIPQIEKAKEKNQRDLVLKRFRYLLKLLGNPHLDLNYIHVGGTAGKGSVAVMIAEILTQAGYQTGLFTSPFQTTSIEKIRINDQLIDPKDFALLVEKIKPTLDAYYQTDRFGRPTYFELFLAVAFLYFKKQKCDYVVLEVGIGGQNAPTNIIPKPVATIINLVSFDHQEILGKTLNQITAEKNGIIKPKTIFFTTSQNHSGVIKQLKNVCQKNQAEFNVINLPRKKYQLAMVGEVQKYNAALAEAVAKKLGLSQKYITTGLKKAKLPCRFEMIQKNPLVILDGAHNISKIKSVLENLKNLTYQKLYLIIALTNKRQPKKIFAPLIPLAKIIYLTRFETTAKKCYPPLKLKKELNLKDKGKIYLDAKMALSDALKKARRKDLILITGSFYLAGELRKRWRSEEKILRERRI